MSSLLYHNLKIMLHRPFFKTAPSMHDLDEFKRPEMVHIQSATFSAIRITSIVNAYRNFYPLVSTFNESPPPPSFSSTLYAYWPIMNFI